MLIFVVGLFTLMISSCGGETKNPSEHTKTPHLDTNTSYNFSDNIWDSRDTICFKEYVDTSNNYFINISLRNTTSYEYQNIIFFNHHYFNNNFIETDTIEILLSENDGRWIGGNIAESNLIEILYTHNNKFSFEEGEHYFKLELAMRENTSYQIDRLENITSISLSLIKEEDIILETPSDQLSLQEEYYIPKPKAQIKIKLPSEETSIYVDDIITFNYSKSAFIDKESQDTFSIVYPDYDAYIHLKVNSINQSVEHAIKTFDLEVRKNCMGGAEPQVHVIEKPQNNIYGNICYFFGDRFSKSSIFFLTDGNKYFLAGHVFFYNYQLIDNEIVLENEIMKKEVSNIINSFKWSSIPK